MVQISETSCRLLDALQFSAHEYVRPLGAKIREPGLDLRAARRRPDLPQLDLQSNAMQADPS